MSQRPRSRDHSIHLQGQDLLQAIGDRPVRLPGRTVLVLAVGGLRVRLLRSLITLTSVVLAIAFLGYTGLSNCLVLNLAKATTVTSAIFNQRDAAEIERLLRQSGTNIRQVLDETNQLDNWLITMALLTCAVGIANAMLMSVSERFREIGTMKCLGAVDSLVVKLFLIESGLVGLVGAGFGIVLGGIVALLAGVVQFKAYGWSQFPWADGISIVCWSLVAGLVLSVAGAGYPAIVATRMNPVDALRVDE